MAFSKRLTRDTEAEAAAFCKPDDASQHESSAVQQEMFIVWKGNSTGVMSAAECIKATAGVVGAKADGPMSVKEAEALWLQKKDKTKTESGVVQELKHIEYPTDEEWQKVANSKQSRVFACWVKKGYGRIAFTWEAAAKGVKDNVSVKVFSAESTIFLNFARAEEYLSTAKSGGSIKEQIAAARKSISKTPKASASRSRKLQPAATSHAAKSGQSVGSRVGMSGVVRTREVTQIRRCFIDAKVAVEIKPSPHEPEEDELERDMPAPGAATYLSEDVSQHLDANGDLTLLEFFSYKKGKVKAWPLMEYDDFLSFCRQGQRLCAGSSKEVGVANAAFFIELMDIAVRTHGQMLRRGTLGPKEIRFQVRMYLHLQYATNYRVLHSGASAMRAFEAAVDTFGSTKVSSFRSAMKGASSDKGPLSGRKTVLVQRKNGGTPKPASGCYLCPASDHYASDQKFHPRPANGKRAPLSTETKKAIFDRVDASDLSAEEKHAEKSNVKKYWSQHSL